jgi:hypothetical protein
MLNHRPRLFIALRSLVPPIHAVFLATVMGIMLGSAVPVPYLQQAAGPLSHLSSSVIAGR